LLISRFSSRLGKKKRNQEKGQLKDSREEAKRRSPRKVGVFGNWETEREDEVGIKIGRKVKDIGVVVVVQVVGGAYGCLKRGDCEITLMEEEHGREVGNQGMDCKERRQRTEDRKTGEGKKKGRPEK
jgi:hypothetical protein